jgi:hypothetical protein
MAPKEQVYMSDNRPHMDNEIIKKIHPRAKDCFVISLKKNEYLSPPIFICPHEIKIILPTEEGRVVSL